MFQYSLKTSENQSFSYVFKGYRNGTMAWNELNKHNILAMEVGISQLQSLIQLYFFR